MKKLKLMGAQALTREQQRSINGGSGGSTPGGPSGGSGTEQYKCCWDNDSSNCSVCVDCTSSCTCVANASLKKC